MKRIQIESKKQGYTQETLADAMGVSRTAVSKWFMGMNKPNMARYEQLLELLGLDDISNQSAHTINNTVGNYSGNTITGNNNALGKKARVTQDSYNLPKDAQPVRHAPVLDYIQAGNFSGVSNLPEGIDHTIVPEDVELDYENDFILKVRGDSMYNPNHKKSLLPDELVVVDTKRSPNIGDVVVAYVSGACEATIKLLTGEVGNMYLEPLNQKYLSRNGFVVPKDDEVHIKGVVKAVIPPVRRF
ncbi:helix-turn-helix domain-containing protein [Francisella philomiragia]|uniref:Helix-turn-helix domain-containing protein n=2 Tax=Francisella philomiragia TaxID=28110 RepID=A0ABS1GAF0_9GAMM|nr:LexA family transcriptional regulator [Francisella philomiragia]MBK2258415.1 helix-turn-helix domain-containing protein [Francisella philomiragia]MBK2301787.1 helix-turn-helix domain-containing protein [Francisella philomiragia]